MRDITYIETAPHDIQNMIYYYLHRIQQEEVHIELLCEISNDIPPNSVIVYDNPTLYMIKLQEVMTIISDQVEQYLTMPKCYKYFIWFLIKYFTFSPQSTWPEIGDYTMRGDELFNHITLTNAKVHRMTYTIKNHVERNHKRLIEIENFLSIMTYHELAVFKLFMSNIKDIIS
jgi:hypothetical protein